jgi:hypothetical protein
MILCGCHYNVEQQDKSQPNFVARYADVLPEVSKLRPCALDAFLLFQDLSLLTAGKSPIFLRLEELDKSFGLELMESIIGNHYRLLRDHTPFVTLIGSRVVPLLMTSMSERGDFQLSVRLTRVLLLVIRHFVDLLPSEIEMLVSIQVEMIGSELVEWHKVLLMEVMRHICGDFKLIRTLFQTFDDDSKESSHVFADILRVCGVVAASKPSLLGLNRSSTQGIEVGAVGLSISNSGVKIQLMDMLDKSDAPIIPDTYLAFLSFQCFISLTDGLSNAILPRALDTINNSGQHKSYDVKASVTSPIGGTVVRPNQLLSEQLPSDKAILVLSRMLLLSREPIAAALIFFFRAKLDTDLFHSVARSYQNLTISAGALFMESTRDALTFELCRLINENIIQGNSSQFSMTPKALFQLRALLNISHSLSHILSVRSWISILRTFWFADIALGSGQLVSLDVLGDDSRSAINNEDQESATQGFIVELRSLIVESSNWDIPSAIRFVVASLWLSMGALEIQLDIVSGRFGELISACSLNKRLPGVEDKSVVAGSDIVSDAVSPTQSSGLNLQFDSPLSPATDKQLHSLTSYVRRRI